MSRNQITGIICASMACAKQMVEVNQTLEQQGIHCVLPPNTEKYASGEMLDVGGSEGGLSKVQGNLIRNYYQQIKNADFVLVVNCTKGSLPNYIGGNIFLEMGFGHVLNKPIFVLHGLPEQKNETRIIWQEIFAIGKDPETILLYGDLDRLVPTLKELRPELFPAADKVCDHTSVGALIWQDDKLLLIERRKYPFGFAPPAGHIDKRGGVDPWISALKQEVQEETGLTVDIFRLIGRFRAPNPCRRVDGTWHSWKLYKVTEFSGELMPNPDETKQASWYNREQIQALAQKTMGYLSGQITESQWQQNPGLEPVWCRWFLLLGFLDDYELIQSMILEYFRRQ